MSRRLIAVPMLDRNGDNCGKIRLFRHWPSWKLNTGYKMNVEVPTMPDDEKPSTTLPGTVEKIIKPWVSGEPEKAQISVEGADHLYREIRIENNLTNAEGETVSLKPGADTIKKSDETPPAKKAS
jgi:hypothetical protein